MKDDITVIITIRNRESSRIVNQVESIRNEGANPHFHIVDYGSNTSYATQYEKVCRDLHLQYTHMYSEGLPWNKCKAINYGAKVATTPFIVTSDVDMIYEGNSFQWCLDNYCEKHMYHIETFWLPENGTKTNSTYAGHGNSGGFQFIKKNAFNEIGGYDEGMVYWGQEDIDWPARLKLCGYTQIWLPEEYKIYHQWHPKENSSSWKRPVSATQNTLKRLYTNTFTPKLASDWGKAIQKQDRPILDEMNTSTPHVITFKDDALIHFGLAEKLLSSKKYSFVKVELGNRIKSLSSTVIKDILKAAIKPSATYQPRLNISFDALYELLPVLQENGLKDYYITSDLSEVYLLWE